MNLIQQIRSSIDSVLTDLYQVESNPDGLLVSDTKKEHEGDFTLTVFAIAKAARKSPEQTGQEVGEALTSRFPALFNRFNVIKGFLNLVLVDGVWITNLLAAPYSEGVLSTFMVEYSSPNTNKPLHLGHIRNNLLGHSVSEILKALGHPVIKVNLVNDRGVHICKSMLAWQRWGNGETPVSSGMKGDKLVGKYYVIFDKELKKEQAELIATGLSEEEAAKQSALMTAVRAMLLQWEAADPAVKELWARMNGWVYDGFASTYARLGIRFDKIYYESETYLLGKKIVEEGLQSKVFYQEADQSVWIDLSAEGLDKKVLQRGDGTSVYITQDIGTAQLRHDEFHPDQMVYVVANEQDYHFKVLKHILTKLGRKWAAGLYHFSYGMVDLPTGKMKSREGTVVDADDLIEEMVAEAEKLTLELGKTQGMDQEEMSSLYETLGLGALKYFMLKVDPRKRMLFDPKESIDFNGNTGPFIQYTYARIGSVLRKANAEEAIARASYANITQLHDKERELIKQLARYHESLKAAAKDFNPALIAHFVYELAKSYNSFYHECPIMKEDDKEKAKFRTVLSEKTADKIQQCLHLLGIAVPERM